MDHKPLTLPHSLQLPLRRPTIQDAKLALGLVEPTLETAEAQLIEALPVPQGHKDFVPITGEAIASKLKLLRAVWETGVTNRLSRLIAAMPPHGSSEKFHWDGGSLALEVSGVRSVAAGISTRLEVHVEPHLPPIDGQGLESARVGAGERLAEIRESGHHVVNVPPGYVQFVADGPTNAEWRVSVAIAEQKPREKSSTAKKTRGEQRV